MNVPLTLLRARIPSLPGDPDAVTAELERRGFSVSRVVPLAELLQPIVAARVESVTQHPNADRLKVCAVNDGSGTPLQIVTGASNVEAGGYYPLIRSGVTLPTGVKIKKGKLRGEVSEGMLGSADELGLGSDHAGLLPLSGQPEPGTPLPEVISVDGVVLVVDGAEDMDSLVAALSGESPSPTEAATERRTIVVTGASGGIGAALARALGARGHRLVLAARRPAELQRVADEVRAAGGEAIAVETDVTRRGDVERLAAAAVDAFGGFDAWVNNAGRGISRPVLELTDEDVDEMMTVNVKSALYGVQAAVAHFQPRGAGHVVNVSSFLGRVPLAAPRSAYSAAKAALNSLTANLRMDLAASHPGIHVSLVMPGVVLTEFAGNSRGAPASPPVAPPAGSMQPQTAEEVAEIIAGLIEQPRAEVYTNPASPELARRYYADVGAFEAAAFGTHPSA